MDSVYNETCQDAAATADQETVTDHKDQTKEDTEAGSGAGKMADKSTKKNLNKLEYEVDDDGTHINKELIANFVLNILQIENKWDCEELKQQTYYMEVSFKGKKSHFHLPAGHFSAGKLIQAIRKEIGPEAWLAVSESLLILGIQQNLSDTIPRTSISLSTGFNKDYSEFWLPNLRITKEGIQHSQQSPVLLPDGYLANKAKFQILTDSEIKRLTQNIFFGFRLLKSSRVMLPIIGQIGIAVLASWIGNSLGKQKYTLHLKGVSGGGKTFIANLVGSFFGNSGDRLISWSSTANAIEAEGYHFRDQIYIADDYKRSVTSPRELTRVLQNYADNHGRSRLNSSSSKTNSPYIRGFLLSTGEDFVENVESVSARTIVLAVEHDHNLEAGNACRNMQHLYNGFIPKFVHWLISQENWQENLKNFIESKIEELLPLVNGISNGLRIVSNWAINAAGFEMLCRFAVHVEAIDYNLHMQLLTEYAEVVRDHLRSQEAFLKAENPVSIFFDMLEQLIFTETVAIKDLPGKSPKKTAATIGKVIEGEVQFYHSIAIPHLINHARQLNQPLPFTKENLRNALDQEGLLIRQNGRLSVQVRHQDGQADRVQAWKFDLTEFKKRCLDAEGV